MKFFKNMFNPLYSHFSDFHLEAPELLVFESGFTASRTRWMEAPKNVQNGILNSIVDLFATFFFSSKSLLCHHILNNLKKMLEYMQSVYIYTTRFIKHWNSKHAQNYLFSNVFWKFIDLCWTKFISNEII